MKILLLFKGEVSSSALVEKLAIIIKKKILNFIKNIKIKDLQKKCCKKMKVEVCRLCTKEAHASTPHTFQEKIKHIYID
jgi:hypothetical protein